MRQYLDLLRHVMDNGTDRGDRTGTGTRSVFGYQMRFDLGAGLSAADDQEDPPQVGDPRAAVVPPRRDQCALAAGARGQDLGRVGRRERRPRAGLRQPVALVAGREGRDDRPDRGRGALDPDQAGIAAAHRDGVEPGRGRRHGAAAVPLPVPVLCRQGPAELPALPAERATSSSACRSTSRPMRC